MNVDRTTSYLAEVAFFQEGPGILAKDFHESGIPLLRLKGIEGPFASLDGCNFLDPAKVDKKWGHFKLVKGDLLISTSASLGRVSIVTEATEGAIPYTGIIRFRPKSETLSDEYLRAFLSSSEFAKQAESMASGSVIKHFGPSHIKQMMISLPPIEQQRKIGKLNSVLEDAIRTLGEQNTTLEAIAQTLFRSWFVNFDPVHANATSLTPEGMSPELAALFPSEFVESELGMIPRGWKVDSLSNQLQALESGKRPKGGVGGITEGIPSIGAESIKGLGRFEFGKTKYVSEDFYNTIKKGIPEDFDLLIYKDGGKPGEFFPKFGMYGLGFPFRKFALNEHVFLARAGGQLSPSFLYFLAQEKSFYDHLKERGTKVAVPGVNQRDVGEFQLVVPTSDLIQAFSHVGQPIVEQVLTNCLQCRTLSELRDELLPRLISGKLRIEEAEEVVSEVLGSTAEEEKAA